MDMNALASPLAFAEGYLYAVILSISLKTSLEMAAMEKYKYVMDATDSAGIFATKCSVLKCKLKIF